MLISSEGILHFSFHIPCVKKVSEVASGSSVCFWLGGMSVYIFP